MLKRLLLISLSLSSSLSFADEGQISKITSKKQVTDVKPIEAGFSMGYGLSTDLATQKSPRLYTHRLSTGMSLGFKDVATKQEMFSLSLGISGQYKSLNDEVESKSEVIELSDVNLGIGKSFELGRTIGADHSLSLDLGNSFPTSDQSRYEGVQAAPSAGIGLSSKFKWFSLSQGVSVSHVVNSYEYSPVSGDINSDTSTSYSISLGAKFLKYFRASVGGNVATTHYLDGSRTMGFGNSQSLSASLGRWSASLRHSNGSHFMDKDVDLWFVDEYRRLVSFNLSCGF